MRAVGADGKSVKAIALFQFSPSREGGLANVATAFNGMLFQFSPSREGGRLEAYLQIFILIFQFSPSREGGQVSELHISQAQLISILALA